MDSRKFKLNKDGYLVIHQIDETKDNLTYADQNNFTDISTLQYIPALNLYFDYLKHQTDSEEPGLENLYYGTANGWDLTKNINSYLVQFFDSILKDKSKTPFGNCSQPLTKNSKLICGPASDV